MTGLRQVVHARVTHGVGRRNRAPLRMARLLHQVHVLRLRVCRVQLCALVLGAHCSSNSSNNTTIAVRTLRGNAIGARVTGKTVLRAEYFLSALVLCF